jgi:hypothetical protein
MHFLVFNLVNANNKLKHSYCTETILFIYSLFIVNLS